MDNDEKLKTNTTDRLDAVSRLLFTDSQIFTTYYILLKCL